MARRRRKTFRVRRKQRLGLGWLLLLPLAGLPLAVFFAWKEPLPPTPRPVMRDARTVSPDAANAETLPTGENAVGRGTPEVVPEMPAEVPGTARPEIAATAPAPDSLPPQQHNPAPSRGEYPPQPATPLTPKMDWEEIASRPGRWPAQTRMKAPVDFPISVGGKRSGSTRVPAGASVKVVKIAGDGVEIRRDCRLDANPVDGWREAGHAEISFVAAAFPFVL